MPLIPKSLSSMLTLKKETRKRSSEQHIQPPKNHKHIESYKNKRVCQSPLFAIACQDENSKNTMPNSPKRIPGDERKNLRMLVPRSLVIQIVPVSTQGI